jgi:hypothetical protein
MEIKMGTLSQNQQENLELLEASLGVQDVQYVLGEQRVEGSPSPALCASLKREERLQYNFMWIYQILVLILALIVLALVAFAAWRIVTGDQQFQAVIAGASALISSAAAAFLIKQRQDARDVHAAAKAGLEKYNCP